MPKDQFTKIKGAVRNVPIEADTLCNSLHTAYTAMSDVVVVKKKTMLSWSCLIEIISPDVVHSALNYL